MTALASAIGFSGNAWGVTYGRPRGRAALLLRIALLRGLFGPHLFEFAHVFGFHAHKNAISRPPMASHFGDSPLCKTPTLTTDNTDDTDLHRSKKSNRFTFAHPSCVVRFAVCAKPDP